MDLALLERIGAVSWPRATRAADLGCGTGRTGAWLRSKGVAHIDGVDLTPEMLQVARGTGVYDQLITADVAATGLPSRAYDVVICCLVDEHLRELTSLYREAGRLLRPSGFFVLLGYHPFFIMATGMPTHFEHPVRGPVAIEMHVHLFSEHMAAARDAGLVARELHEAVVDETWIRLKPKWEPYRGWPVSFAGAFQSASEQSDT